MAFTGNKQWYISSAKWNAAAAWAANTAYAVGDIVRQNAAPTAGNERTFVCVVAGTSHATTEPTWTVTRGAKTTDNTVTWQEFTGMAAANGDLTNTPTWTSGAKNTNVTQGHVITSDNGQITLICDVGSAVASNGAEPTWNTTLGGTTADGATVVWRTLKISGNKFANWACAHARANNAMATNWGDGNGQTFCWGSDHSESQASTNNVSTTARGTNASPNTWISVNTAGSVPPVEADLTVGASVTTTGSAVSIQIRGALKWVFGLIFTAGTSNSCFITTNDDGTLEKFFEQCEFRAGSGAGSGSSPLSFNVDRTRTRFKDCKVKFSNSGQALFSQGFADFENLILDSTGTKPTNFIQNTQSGNDFIMTFRGCDFSFMTTGTFITMPQRRMWHVLFEDCKFPSGLTSLCDSSALVTADQTATFIRCHRGVAGDFDYQFFGYEGTQTIDTQVVRHAGAGTLNAQAFSWKLVSTSVCNFGADAFRSSRFGFYNQTTAADVTLTCYGVANAAAMPKNLDVWLHAQYLQDASDSYSKHKSTRATSPLNAGTSLTADSTSDWDDNAPARQNTHAYSVGDVISVASNTGRIFFCTTAGTSAGSEPGGYASAVDGGSVTDNTAVFRAGWRFSIQLVLTSPQPAQKGNVNCHVTLGSPSLTVFIDPKLVVT